MVDVSGHYTSPSTRALESIVDTRYPQSDPNFTSTISDLKQDVKFMAGYMQTMQKGIDKANEDTFQQIGDLISGITVLLGGGDVTKIDFGDLKYYLPAIGAMFGWDSTTPFPINLYDAAQTFFLGYVVSTDAWNNATNKMFDDNLEALGFTPSFIQQLNEFVAASNGPSSVISGDINEFFTSIQTVLNIFGVGPNAANAEQTQLMYMWTILSKLFGNVNPDGISTIQDFISNTLADWLDLITKVNNWLTSVLQAWSDSTDTQGFLNFASLFNGIDWTSSTFDIGAAWNTIVNNFILGTDSFIGALSNYVTTGNYEPLLAALGWSTGITSTITPAAVPGLDASKIVSGSFAQSFVTGLAASLASLLPQTTYQSLLDNIANAMGHAGTGYTLDQIESYLGLIPGTNIASAVLASVVPNLDASKITTGTFPNTMSPGLLPQSLWQAAAGSNNLVISPNFEDTTIARTTLQPGKTGATFGYSTAVARSGTHSYAVVTDSSTGSNEVVFLSPTTVGGEGSLTDASAIKVQAGQWFYSEIYVRGNAANTATAGSLLIAAYLADSSGVNATINPHLSAIVSAGGLSSTVWTKISGWYQIPAGYDRLWPMIWLSGVNAAAQTYYFDDARIVENTQAQAIAQQLFGGGNILSTILAATVPALDASKVTTGTFTNNNMFPNLLPQTLWQAGQGSGTNLILSPQFDDSTIARATGSFGQTVPAVFGYSTTVARSGTQSYKVITSTPTTSNNDLFYLMPSNATSLTAANAIKVQAGQWFYGEFYVRADAANAPAAGTVRFMLSAQSSTGSPAVTNLQLGSVNMVGLSSAAWTKVSGWVQIPTGYDLVYPFAWLVSCTTPAQTFYFDDARLIEDTQAQAITQQLFGGSSVLSAILAATVPSLDASKITTGTFAQSFVNNLTNEVSKIELMLTAPNLVLDPTFDNAVMWNGEPGAQVTSPAHSGTKSWQLVGAG